MPFIQQAVNRCSDYFSQVINWTSILEWYERYAERAHTTMAKTSKGERVTIGVAIGLAVLYTMYDRAAKPPRHLRHIPYINSFTSHYRFIVSKWKTNKISQELAMPILRHSPMYLRNDKFGWTVHVCTPSISKHVFLKGDFFPKADQSGATGTIIQRLIGNSNNILLDPNDEVWKKHRKLANPAFHRSMPVKLFGELSRKLFTVLDKDHPDDFTIDVGKAFECLTLDVIGLAGFDFDFNAITDKNSPWKLVYDTVIAGHRHPLFHFFPILEKHFLWLFPERRHVLATVTKFLEMLQEVIEHKRRALKQLDGISDLEGEAEKDLLTLMIESELRGEGALTDRELLSDICIFFIAGHDTTSAALTASCYYLATHPEVQQKARDEVNHILCPGGVEPDTEVIPTSEQTKELIYVNQVIHESMRMNTSVASLLSPRRATQDVMLDNKLIPKGTLVNVNMHDLHHNPNVWDDPETFNPDRFAPGGEADQKAGGGMPWVPFSNGARMCIGQRFSLTEQKVVLACLLRKYTWELPEDSIHKDEFVTTNANLTCPYKVDIRFHRRY